MLVSSFVKRTSARRPLTEGEAAGILTHLPDRGGQSADCLRGFPAAPAMLGRSSYWRLQAMPTRMLKAFPCGTRPYFTLSFVEATTGIEPVYAVLQTAP